MKSAFLLILLITTHFGWCQTDWYSSIPFRFQPSFAGSSGNINGYGRFLINSNRGYKAYGYELAGDAFLKKLITGVGFSIGHSNGKYAYDGNYSADKSSSATCIIAPKFSRKEKFTFSPSLETTFRMYNSNSLHVLNAFPDSTFTVNFHTKMNIFQANLGALFNTKKFFLGFKMPFFTIENLIHPDGSYFLNPKIYTISAGYTFKKLNSQFSYTLVVNTQIINYSDSFVNQWHINFIAYNQFKYKFLLFGVDTDLQLMAGLEIKRFRVMLTERNDAWRYPGNYYNRSTIALRYKFGEQN